MSASSRPSSEPVVQWVAPIPVRRPQPDRLFKPMAVPLIILMSAAGWIAIWKGVSALLTLLR